MFEDICLNCFQDRNGYDVCPHCGYVNGTPPEVEYHLHPGTILNERYIVGTVLGFGGFGITYKVWDFKLGSVVAIKEFYPGGLVNRVPGESEVQIFDGTEKNNFKESLARFIDEAKNLAQFNGKANIVNVFGFFEENNTAYYVMEYLDGVSLKEYIEQNGKMPVDTALVVINDLLTGVGEVHNKGILHRDIAPDNIILTNEGVVKILDFGSARFSAEHSDKTLSAFIKPGYAAPEQYASQGEQGVWTDIYGLGATMYYMVTGIKPDESTDRRINDTVQRPSDMGIELPIEVDKAIMKAMALQIEFRFKSTDEFLAAIQGDYEIEYPDVEIKKRKRKRNIMAGVSAAGFVAAIALTFVLYNVLKTDPYDEIAPETQLNMWVYVDNKAYDPGKSNLPESFKEIVQDNKTMQYEKQKEAYYNLANNFSQFMNDAYPDKNIKLNMLVFEDKEGYDVEMRKAIKNNNLPDVFFAGDLYSEISDKCLKLTDFKDVFDNAGCNYITSSNYSELYPDEKLIPLGFNAPVVYVNNSLVSDYNIPSDVNKGNFNSIDEIKKLDAYTGKKKVTSISNGKETSVRTVGVDSSAYSSLVALYGGDITNKDSTSTITEANTSVMQYLKSEYNDNGFNSTIPVENYFYYGQLAYLVGDTSIFEYVNNYLGGNYSIATLTNNGKSVVNLDTEVAINADVDESKRLVARALIEYLLSEDGQAYVDIIGGSSLPINKKQMDSYVQSVNENFDVIATDYTDAILIGENGGADSRLGNQLYKNCYIGDEDIADNTEIDISDDTEIDISDDTESETVSEDEIDQESSDTE